MGDDSGLQVRDLDNLVWEFEMLRKDSGLHMKYYIRQFLEHCLPKDASG